MDQNVRHLCDTCTKRHVRPERNCRINGLFRKFQNQHRIAGIISDCPIYDERPAEVPVPKEVVEDPKNTGFDPEVLDEPAEDLSDLEENVVEPAPAEEVEFDKEEAPK